MPGLLLLALPACSTTPIVEDPVAVLRDPAAGPRRHLVAIDMLKPLAPGDDDGWSALAGTVWRPGYRPRVRTAAIDVLRDDDAETLRKLLDRRLPRIEDWSALEVTCERVAQLGWVDLAPALVRSWARAVPGIPDRRRPEYVALASLLGGEEQVEPYLLETFLATRSVAEQGLRTRCWELLHRLGHREALRRMLAETEPEPGDVFMLDLVRGARELSVVPHNREEVLWLRSLYMPERAAFLAETRAALAALPADRRRDLEIRHLPVVVACARHRPDLLDTDPATLHARLEARLRGGRFHAHEWNSGDAGQDARRPLERWRDELTFGDLLTFALVLEALDEPSVVTTLYAMAERDRLDDTTEYGGLVSLDDAGRFRIVEFSPKLRAGDRKFHASQAMLDAAYTALLHFHFHVQRYANREFAGPGPGDLLYAERLRANCLVLTFTGRDALNVDFYRHGPVVVDFGEIRRPAGVARTGE
ncbi:MAG: hypothetical protein ACYTGP_04580 [Planctomycetota bacterium]